MFMMRSLHPHVIMLVPRHSSLIAFAERIVGSNELRQSGGQFVIVQSEEEWQRVPASWVRVADPVDGAEKCVICETTHHVA